MAYCSFILQCNIWQSVKYYSVILQYDSSIAVCITSIVLKYCISVDEKFLNFPNIVICTNLTNLVFLPTLKWTCNFNAKIRTQSPWISLYTHLFGNQHTKNELKQLILFAPSKVTPYPLHHLVYNGFVWNPSKVQRSRLERIAHFL